MAPFAREFELSDDPGEDVVVLAFGPDVLERAARLPALRRVAMLFPGFGCDPYHNLAYRKYALAVIESCYDLVFVNPGALEVSYEASEKVCVCPFSIDTRLVQCRSFRRSIESLIHISAKNAPQKDWPRSENIMKQTGLRYEIFPPRHTLDPLQDRFKRAINRHSWITIGRPVFRVMLDGYVDRSVVIEKYQEYDGFVHVASEIKDGIYIDGKYTATLMEAGATGAILFWHDTLRLGNDFETVFDLPLEPAAAARSILDVRNSIDVPKHSRATREEILDKCNADRSVAFRCAKIKELL